MNADTSRHHRCIYVNIVWANISNVHVHCNRYKHCTVKIFAHTMFVPVTMYMYMRWEPNRIITLSLAYIIQTTHHSLIS